MDLSAEGRLDDDLEADYTGDGGLHHVGSIEQEDLTGFVGVGSQHGPWAMELRYDWLGSRHLDMHATDGTAKAMGTIEHQAVSASVVRDLGPLYLRGGVHVARTSAAIKTQIQTYDGLQRSMADLESTTGGLVYGIGLQWRAARLEYTVFTNLGQAEVTGSTDAQVLSLGIKF